MKFKKLFTAIATATVVFIASSAQAQTYTGNDLLLGFRSTSGSQCYVVNIGQASQFTGASGPVTVSGLGDIATDLAAVFGNDWNGNRADMFWSVSGATGSFAAVGSDPLKTLYVTKVRTSPGTQTTPWIRASSTAQGTTTNLMKALGNQYITYSATANSPGKGVIQTNTDINAYASYQPGGTVDNSGPAPGTSFKAFNPTIEGTFTTGVANSVLDLYRLIPNTGSNQPGEFIGTFTIATDGTLTFTPPTNTPGTIAFSAATYTQVESSTVDVVKTITVNRTGGSLGAASVQVTISAGTATVGDDYTATTPVTLNWADGDSAAKTVSVTVKTDAAAEGDETVLLALQNVTGATLGTTTSATLTISDPPPVGSVAFSSATYSQAEPLSGTTAMTITVNRTGGTAGAISVEATIAADTATVTDDYTATTPATLNWADGDSAAKTFTITVNADLLTESAETINLVLQNATGGATIGAQNTAVATIVDTPPVPGTVAFSSATYSQTEPSTGTAAMTITVNRTGGTSGAVSVEATVVGNTATVTDDYTATSPTTLNWADGDSAAKTFTITVKADALAESAETIDLALQNGTGNVTISGQTTAVATINDLAPTGTLAFSSATYSQAEPVSGTAAMTITVNRTGGSSGAASVQVAVTAVSASSTDDYTVTSPVTLNWTAGDATAKTFTISIKADTATENDETISLALQNATGATLAAQLTTATATITDTVVIPLAQLSGSYNGLITPDTDPLLHSGLINVKVTPKGTFTGKATLGGTAITIKGAFNASGTGGFGTKTLTPTFELVKKAKPANISLGFLSLTLDVTGGNKVTGTLKDQAGTTALGTIAHADRALYSSKKVPVAPFMKVPTSILDTTKEKGKYTAIFGANAAPNNGVAKVGFAQGDGYGAVTVSSSGIVKVIGKLADGSVINYANALSKNNEWPVFIQLYGKGGFITGNVAFDPAQTQTDAKCTGMSWFKPDTTAFRKPITPYPAGWPNGITTDFVASKYFVPTKPTVKNPTPPNPDTVLGLGVPGALLTTTDNIFITLADGGLTTNTSNDASLSTKNKVTVHGATATFTAATGLKIAFVSGTGAMSGSFTHPGTGKAVKFFGTAYQKTNTASGYFIYAAPGTPAESGAVGVAEKP